jgi:hypothetical protein
MNPVQRRTIRLFILFNFLLFYIVSGTKKKKKKNLNHNKDTQAAGTVPDPIGGYQTSRIRAGNSKDIYGSGLLRSLPAVLTGLFITQVGETAHPGTRTLVAQDATETEKHLPASGPGTSGCR